MFCRSELIDAGGVYASTASLPPQVNMVLAGSLFPNRGLVIRLAFFAVFHSLQPLVLSAQLLTGVALEDSTRAPISGAIIEIIGIDRAKDGTAVTDSTGAFVIRLRRSGSFVLHVHHPSYVSRDSMGLQIRAGQVVQLEVRMGRRAIPLEPLVVKTRFGGRLAGFMERVREGGPGIFLTREELDVRKGGQYTTDLLRGLAGVQVVALVPTTSNETMPRTQVIVMGEGTSSCEPAVFIDGMRVKQYGDSGVDDLLRPDIVEGVEIYPRSVSAPAEFLTSNQCGVVVFWTRATSEVSGKLTWRRVRMVGLFVLAMTGVIRLMK